MSNDEHLILAAVRLGPGPVKFARVVDYVYGQSTCSRDIVYDKTSALMSKLKREGKVHYVPGRGGGWLLLP